MSVVRHPAVCDLRNAVNRAAWAQKWYGGEHFPDLRTPDLYRLGEWIALQVSWLRRGYHLLDRPTPTQIQVSHRVSRAALFFRRARRERPQAS